MKGRRDKIIQKYFNRKEKKITLRGYYNSVREFENQ